MIAVADNCGYVLSPLTIAPANKADIVLLSGGLKDLKRVAAGAGIEIKGARINLDAGFDSKANRQIDFNAGLKPKIAENPRNCQSPKRGRRRTSDAVLYSIRLTTERVFAWEDEFKRLLLRFETEQKRHLGFKLMAFTLINLGEFCEG